MNEHSEEIWRALACPDDVNSSIPAQELEMAARIEGDLSATTVKDLRSMISWITEKSIVSLKIVLMSSLNTYVNPILRNTTF